MPRVIRGNDAGWAIGTEYVARIPLEYFEPSGRLTADAIHELNQVNLSPPRPSDTFHVTLFTTTKCNLGCAYCFQNVELRAEGPPVRIAGRRLTRDRLNDTLKFVQRRMGETGRPKLDVMLFGGEPLLEADACLEFLEGAQTLGLVSAEMISNGVLMTYDLLERLSARGLRWVQVSLDGKQADHDVSRITRGGRGTFDGILTNLSAVQNLPNVSIQLRVNLTANSLLGASGLLDELALRLDPSNFAITFSLVHDAGIYAAVLDPGQSTAAAVSDLYVRAMEMGFVVTTPVEPAPCIACGVVGGQTGCVISPDGTLYSCWESAGKGGFEVGSVKTGYLPDERLADRWVSCGYSAALQVDPSDRRLFQDHVAAAVLDWQFEHERLGVTGSRWASTL